MVSARINRILPELKDEKTVSCLPERSLLASCSMLDSHPVAAGYCTEQYGTGYTQLTEEEDEWNRALKADRPGRSGRKKLRVALQGENLGHIGAANGDATTQGEAKKRKI